MSINELFDAIPHTRLGRLSREQPAFRVYGVVGYYCGLIAVLSLAPPSGRSLLATAAASCVCAGSFFAYAHLRRAITGHEELVLLEHVWFALACCVATFWLLGVSIETHLDLIAFGLSIFLAWGRIGCLMVGCCHGQPCRVGIRYGHAAARDGFPAHLVGVRLFPVQLVEASGLAAIAVALVPIVLFAPAGSAVRTFLLAYAILRFGLEGLRSDARPHLAGLSQSRWMAIGEGLLALALATRDRLALTGPRELAGALGVCGATLALMVWRHAAAAGRAKRFGSAEHIAELRGLIDQLASGAAREPSVRTSSLGWQLAVSKPNAWPAREAETTLAISFLPAASGFNVEQLCAIASASTSYTLREPCLLDNGALLVMCANTTYAASAVRTSLHAQLLQAAQAPPPPAAEPKPIPSAPAPVTLTASEWRPRPPLRMRVRVAAAAYDTSRDQGEA